MKCIDFRLEDLVLKLKLCKPLREVYVVDPETGKERVEIVPSLVPVIFAGEGTAEASPEDVEAWAEKALAGEHAWLGLALYAHCNGYYCVVKAGDVGTTLTVQAFRAFAEELSKTVNRLTTGKL